MSASTSSFRRVGPGVSRARSGLLNSAPDMNALIAQTIASTKSSCLPTGKFANSETNISRQGADAMEAAEQAAGIAARIGHAEWAAAAHRGLGIACEAAGLPSRAESAYRRSLEAAGGIPFFRAWAAARLGALLARFAGGVGPAH